MEERAVWGKRKQTVTVLWLTCVWVRAQSVGWTGKISDVVQGDNWTMACSHSPGKGRQGKTDGPPLYSRRTTSTALRLAVDHAFTGTYVIRFRPKDPEENSACPCGCLFRTDLHILYDCPRFGAARHISRMVYNGTPTPYHALYRSTNSHRLLAFLQISGALSKPETGPVTSVPPEPD